LFDFLLHGTKPQILNGKKQRTRPRMRRDDVNRDVIISQLLPSVLSFSFLFS
jgi:hypothetical protein